MPISWEAKSSCLVPNGQQAKVILMVLQSKHTQNRLGHTIPPEFRMPCPRLTEQKILLKPCLKKPDGPIRCSLSFPSIMQKGKGSPCQNLVGLLPFQVCNCQNLLYFSMSFRHQNRYFFIQSSP